MVLTELNQHINSKLDKSVLVTQCVLKAWPLLETAKTPT